MDSEIPSDADIPSPSILSEGISKPDDDLSSFDSYQSQSMFDSVRIMEPGSQDRVDDVDTRLHPGSIRLDIPKSEDSGPEAPSSPEKAISSTSHNIGLGDTDGKRGGKLKPLAEGTVLNGRYEIIRKIGGGGMGAVYLASDNNLGGVLRAVKEMVQTHIEEEQQEKAINDFKRESMILSSLDHVSIPTIYDYFYDEKESRFYLVMKYISGGDLSARLRSAPEGKVDEKSVCEWAIQIIDVLDYLHNQPSTIVYRDLKPSNIMIDGNSGRAMLIDFGIARSISQKEEKGVTAVGTMGYAPPELFSGKVEPRSDIYSLGSTMFHLLTGADPQSNPLLIFDFQKNPRPRQINSQLSDQMERLIMKAVQYNADERFHSAAEMREVLEEHLLKLKAGILTYGVGEIPASVSLENQSVFCGFCGQRIVATDMFCAFCGAKQPIAQQGVHVEIYSQAAWTAKLVIEGTSELTAPAFSLQKDDNLLGRRDPMSNIFPEVDLSKYDPQTKISRRHARIWREGSNFLVEDLGSSNGTILSRSVNESFRLPPKQPQVLSAGDRIRLGDATLHFIIG
ncbi:MAG: protein kinase [Acidobacteria bacterium]|nr:protein kinase [Acidobacteriota bacterium]